ncbi:hypothetical protein KY290_036461 [Solanum tuberosum]|uniref:Reverse transcriptase domain-containing protein n=1 Tax=Solanum tuberosum TaxID=4113 RepID=A0ABQ7TSR4_SOLTU|nr:hypothetical protein KY290_036461 [Solanum tuberosum]
MNLFLHNSKTALFGLLNTKVKRAKAQGAAFNLVMVGHLAQIYHIIRMITDLPDSEVYFGTLGLFDHYPATINWVGSQKATPRFKYFNMWGLDPNFISKVKETWEQPITGTRMFQIGGKLNILKIVLRSMNKEHFLDVDKRAEKAQNHLVLCQLKLQQDPMNTQLITEEMESSKEVQKWTLARNKFMQQRSKCQWENTDRFGANWAFVEFHFELLGSAAIERDHVNSQVVNMGPMERFENHTKSLKVTHLCFADDVLMFCKGKFQSILLMLRALKSFSKVLGLETNVTKSNIYGAKMTRQCVNDICELTGYQKGALPFKYLGVPISARKISKVDCEILVNKLTTRVQILLHIHTYWSSMFMLPKQILKGITEVCRNFIWSGKVNTNRALLVAWDLVCRTKEEGGLGITECVIWNEAAVAKYVWNIAQKADNLWVDQVYLKGTDW